MFDGEELNAAFQAAADAGGGSGSFGGSSSVPYVYGGDPPMVLQAATTVVNPTAYWPDDGSQFANLPWQCTVTMAVTASQTSNRNVGLGQPYFYTGVDVNVGDWYSNATGGFAWIVRAIVSADVSDIVCVLEDVNMYNTSADSSGNSSGIVTNDAIGYFFRLNSAGVPILATGGLSFNFTYDWSINLISRFAFTGGF